jgi:hypothetical protein
VIDAYGELCDEGCLAIFGPHITDNAVPTREAIEEPFKVSCISVTGSEASVGEAKGIVVGQCLPVCLGASSRGPMCCRRFRCSTVRKRATTVRA